MAPNRCSRSSNPGLVIEAVKLAEDGSGDVIVRLYESLGERSTGLVTANFASAASTPSTCWSGRRPRRA